MANFNVELNSKPVRNTTEYTLLLRITVDRKHARIKLNYAIAKKHFNSRPKEYKYVRSSHSKHKIINVHIDDKIQEAKDAITYLEKKNLTVTANSIKDKILSPKSANFLEYAKQRANTLKENNHFGNYKKYNTLIKKLEDYRKGEDILFNEITTVFLTAFEAHLVTLDNGVNTINGNFRTIRAIYYSAIEKGVADQSKNPFFTFKLKLSNSNKDRLTLDEISKIEKLELNPESMIFHSSNAFLFSFYNAGICLSDLVMLRWSNIQNGRLVYKMFKTNRVISLILKNRPLSILDLYRTINTKEDDFIFPFFKNYIEYSNPLFLHNQISSKTALINKYLKQIATKVEISKNLTTHTARHSFADIARQKTDNIYNLSKTMAHSNLKVTEAYMASFDDKAVDDTLGSIFN
ncbi:MAG TPA: site-specific integrase [Paludibacter sp.]